MRSLAVLTRNDGSKMNDARLGIDMTGQPTLHDAGVAEGGVR